MVDLGAGKGALTRRLERAVGDPSLEVAFALEDGVTFVDERRRPVLLPDASATRAVTRVADGDRTVAVVVHDPAALRDPHLLTGASAALRIAVANIELEADVRRRVAEVERSRRRLLDASDEQRRRFAAELDKAVIPSLAGAAKMAALARSGADDAEVEQLERRLQTVSAQLRRLTMGLRPAGLDDLGLRRALEELVADAPLEVALMVPAERFEGEAELIVWFVCSEALANVIKHANATRVAIRIVVSDTAVTVDVSDDGAGGADPARGSGLRGLAARVEAVGGVLSLDDGAGGGTRLVVELPRPVSGG